MSGSPPSSGLMAAWTFDGGNNRGEVVVWDTMGSSDEDDWQRVLDKDHVFVGECVLENGLIRLWIQQPTVKYNVKLYVYLNGSWQEFGRLYDVNTPFEYAVFDSIESLSLDKVEIIVYGTDSNLSKTSNYIKNRITLSRGSPFAEVEFLETDQTSAFRFHLGVAVGIEADFVYIQDDCIGDYALSLTTTNSDPSDNWGVMIRKDAGYLALMFVNQTPSTYFRTYQGKRLEYWYVRPPTMSQLKFLVGALPFDEYTNLFKEAEDASLYSGATVDDTQTDDSGNSVLLDAQYEIVIWEMNPNTLPLGRYIAYVRAKDSNQVADDLQFRVFNETDDRYLNEEGDYAEFKLTSTFDYYGIVFDITEDDADDWIRFWARKATTSANSIWIDYFLIIPIGNGESWPQDLAHGAMRGFSQRFNVLRRP